MVQSDDSCSEGCALCVSYSKWTKLWIFVSRCSYYMTPHRKQFATFRSGNFYFVILFYLGDGKAYIITRIRQIKFSIDDGGVWMSNDIRYITKLREKVISLCIIHESESTYKLDKDRNIMKDKRCLDIDKKKKATCNIYKFWMHVALHHLSLIMIQPNFGTCILIILVSI